MLLLGFSKAIKPDIAVSAAIGATFAIFGEIVAGETGETGGKIVLEVVGKGGVNASDVGVVSEVVIGICFWVDGVAVSACGNCFAGGDLPIDATTTGDDALLILIGSIVLTCGDCDKLILVVGMAA